MVPVRTALFQLISARMGWLSQREVILGQSIANADTPDYRPKDLDEAAFARLVAGASGGPSRLKITRTAPAHLDGAARARLGLSGHPQKTPYEVAPAGNAVVLEEQMAKATKTALDYQLTSNLYRKYLGMVRVALGTQG